MSGRWLLFEVEPSEPQTDLDRPLAAGASACDTISRIAEERREMIPGDGIGALVDGVVTLTGSTPTEEEVHHLDRTAT